MPPRTVPFTTLLALLRLRGPVVLLGLIFTSLGVVGLMVLLSVLSSLREPYEAYDYAAIRERGTAATAQVTSVAPVLNVTVNGAHPLLIGYTYAAAGQARSDQFQTMDADGAALHPGDAVPIRVLDGASVIATLKPFSFPVYFFLLLPGVFLVLGLVFLLVGLPRVLRTYRLYQSGEVREGSVLGISTRTTSGRSARQYYLVSYEYAGPGGQSVLGESPTDDLLLVNEKKFGGKVKLFVSPTNETQSCLVPRLEALKNGWQV